MKKRLVAVLCALWMVAAVGCGQKEAVAPGTGEEPQEPTGNAVLDNLNSEPDMP